MKISQLYAEYLYVISNYDKMLSQKKIWGWGIPKKLKDDMSLIRRILGKMLAQNEIQFDTLENISINDFLAMCSKPVLPTELRTEPLTDIETKVVGMMLNSINAIDDLLLKKPTNYKKKVNILLSAFHNLPRSIIHKQKPVFCAPQAATDIIDSLSDYESWMEKYEDLQHA